MEGFRKSDRYIWRSSGSLKVTAESQNDTYGRL